MSASAQSSTRPCVSSYSSARASSRPRVGGALRILTPLLVAVSGLVFASGIEAQTPDPNEQLFVSILGCAGCHGQDAGGGVGPQLRKTALSLEEFIGLVRAPKTNMPPFGPRLASDEDLKGIYEWLQREESAPQAPALHGTGARQGSGR